MTRDGDLIKPEDVERGSERVHGEFPHINFTMVPAFTHHAAVRSVESLYCFATDIRYLQQEQAVIQTFLSTNLSVDMK